VNRLQDGLLNSRNPPEFRWSRPRTPPEPTRNSPGVDVEPTRSRLGTHPEPTQSRPGTHPEPTLQPTRRRPGTYPEPTRYLPGVLLTEKEDKGLEGKQPPEKITTYTCMGSILEYDRLFANSHFCEE
jgi:hypothetical protein